MYGRSATSMVGLYLLALVGVPLATFAIFILGYSFYHALQDHVTYYYYDFFTPYIVEPLYNLMCMVRDMAILFVILLLAPPRPNCGWPASRCSATPPSPARPSSAKTT